MHDDNCTPLNQWNMIDHGLSRFVRDLGACVLRARRPDLAQEEHMGLFSNLTLNTLDDLFLVQLQELYDAEQRLANALPKMAEASSSNPLRSAFKEHLGETKRHVARLERIFDLLGLSHQGQTCEAMKGLIAEGDEAINADGESDVKDAALIAAAQRVEHYEIAGYASARTFAQQLGHEEIAHFLNQTLDEEYGADETLTKIAESFANASAAGS